MLTVGLDVHKQFTYACILDDQGAQVHAERFDSTPAAIEDFGRRRLARDCQVALEATTNCLAFARLLRAYAGRVVISNPMQTKAIAHARIKTDKVDALVLAQLLRTNFLPTVWEPDEDTQLLRRRVAHRQALMSTRIQIKNRIHSILHRNLIELPKISDLFGQGGRKWLAEVKSLPEDDDWQLKQELLMLEHVDKQLAETEAFLAQQAAACPRSRLLLTLPGVQFKTAVGLVAAIGPIERFLSPKKLVSYFGLNPRVTQSGNSPAYTGRISKRGRSHARWLIIEAAQSAARCVGPLQSFYIQLRRKKGHNVAVVAVARKMVCILWHMLQTGVPYRWAPPQLTEDKLRKLELKAGAPKRKTGPVKGEPSKGGRPARQTRRRTDWDAAKLAQAQYQEMVKLWKERNPNRVRDGAKAPSSRVSKRESLTCEQC